MAAGKSNKGRKVGRNKVKCGARVGIAERNANRRLSAMTARVARRNKEKFDKFHVVILTDNTGMVKFPPFARKPGVERPIKYRVAAHLTTIGHTSSKRYALKRAHQYCHDNA